jgi:hypothetical protein
MKKENKTASSDPILLILINRTLEHNSNS